MRFSGHLILLILLKTHRILAEKDDSKLKANNEDINNIEHSSIKIQDAESKTKLNASLLEDISLNKENITNSFLNHTTFFENRINTDAVFRGFYVVIALGCIFLIYIGIKTFRLKRHRAANRYKVIATKGDDQESFFPLAAEDGEDEEIFNASNHHSYT